MMISALLLLLVSNAAQQVDIVDRGVIHVAVVDASGKALPGVTVSLLDSAMKESGRPLITDMHGQATVLIDGVPHGWHWLQFYLAGCLTQAFKIPIGIDSCFRLPNIRVVMIPGGTRCF